MSAEPDPVDHILRRLLPALRRRLLPHALLIEAHHIEVGLSVAHALTRRMLADDMEGDSCDDPASAIFRQIASGAHPDFDLITPEDSKSSRASPVIAVDQVRMAVERFLMTPVSAPSKVMVVSPAEALNNNAVTVLLKIMEEPPAGSTIILVTTNRLTLLDTIRSRCMIVRAPVPRRVAALEENLRSSYGACLKAIISDAKPADRVAAAKQLSQLTKDRGSDAAFSVLLSILQRAVDCHLGLDFEPMIDNEASLLQRYTNGTGLDRMPELWDKLAERKRQLDGLYLDHLAVMTGVIQAISMPTAAQLHE